MSSPELIDIMFHNRTPLLSSSGRRSNTCTSSLFFLHIKINTIKCLFSWYVALVLTVTNTPAQTDKMVQDDCGTKKNTQETSCGTWKIMNAKRKLWVADMLNGLRFFGHSAENRRQDIRYRFLPQRAGVWLWTNTLRVILKPKYNWHQNTNTVTADRHSRCICKIKWWLVTAHS